MEIDFRSPSTLHSIKYLKWRKYVTRIRSYLYYVVVAQLERKPCGFNNKWGWLQIKDFEEYAQVWMKGDRHHVLI